MYEVHLGQARSYYLKATMSKKKKKCAYWITTWTFKNETMLISGCDVRAIYREMTFSIGRSYLSNFAHVTVWKSLSVLLFVFQTIFMVG